MAAGRSSGTARSLIGRGLDQPRGLDATHGLWRPTRPLGRHGELEVASAQHVFVEEANAGEFLIARSERLLSLGNERSRRGTAGRRVPGSGWRRRHCLERQGGERNWLISA